MRAADILTEAWLAEVLEDSLKMGWSATDGARAIMSALEGGLVQLPQAGGQIAEVIGSLDYERGYFERGFIAAAAWAMTKREDVQLSDAVIDHAWAHRNEGMDAGDILPVRDYGATTQDEVKHPDDVAVDLFAARMKAKLSAARTKGRGGWDDPAQCSTDYLRTLLHEHVTKGDPVDVANFCMMLAHYGATTIPAGAAPDDAECARSCADPRWCTETGACWRTNEWRDGAPRARTPASQRPTGGAA